MGHAIGDVLSFGVGVALSPIPIVAVVLMLGTPRARISGPAFLLGWLVGLAVLGTIVLLASGGADASEHAKPATWVSIPKLVLGVLLRGVALRRWRGRPMQGQAAELPKWMRAVDAFKPPRAAAAGVLLSAVNPKNAILTIGAAAAIAQTGIAAGEQAIALAVFVLIGALGPGVPVGVYFVLGDRAPRVLNGMKTWMARHDGAIMAVICVIIGAKLIGDGISGLS